MSEIKYPAGVRPFAENTRKSASNKKKYTPKIAAGNRGMDFEAGINETNAYYAEKGLCCITKRPTPINVVKVDYSKGATITQAYFETQSTTDYNGVYQGHYIDFEAKSSHSKTAFPLSNIPLQQIEHLERVLAHGGIAFFLLHMVQRREVFLLTAEFVIRFYREHPRASIPYADIKEHGYLVPEGFRPRYDYLPVLEAVFLK